MTPHPNDTFNGWTQSGSNRIEWPGPIYSTDGGGDSAYTDADDVTGPRRFGGIAALGHETDRVR